MIMLPITVFHRKIVSGATMNQESEIKSSNSTKGIFSSLNKLPHVQRSVKFQVFDQPYRNKPERIDVRLHGR